MRAVVDTNVFVSSLFGGKPREVIECWKEGRITLCVSAPLVEEYVEVLNRLRADGTLIRELLDLMASGYHLAFTAKTGQLDVVDADPDDNMLFECAVALAADCIVTGDKRVRSVGKYMSIDVLTPAEFLAKLGK